jgi:hypothetical protein
MARDNATMSLDEALEYINETARDKKDELKNLLNNKYSEMKSLITGAALSNAEIMDYIKRSAKERLNKRPVAIIGGIAVTTLLLGYVLGAYRHSR